MPDVTALSPEPSIAPTTTSEQDLVTASQRKINLIWEYTQAVIAVSVVLVSLIAALLAMYMGTTQSAFLSFVCGNVVGFYFSRTNHSNVGGLGEKFSETYHGR